MLRTQGPASRADMARQLSVTPATITRLISELARRGLVQEIAAQGQSGTTREPGRPGVSLSLNPGGAFFLGVEIGVGILRFSLLDLAGSVVTSSELRISPKIKPAEAVKVIGEYAAKLERNARFRGKIRSGGVTVPGLVTADGFVVNLPILGWKKVNLLELLSKAVRLPFLVENNANAAAFGSVYTQPSLPSICTIYLKLGTGCGGAAIVDGRLLRGAAGTAGEFGHIRLTESGQRCSCGQTGCLETWVNLAALARYFHGHDKLSPAKYATLPADVVAAAEAGDRVALAAIESVAHYLGTGIVTLVNIFNPATIMLGGVMRPLLERCLKTIQARVTGQIIPGTTTPDVRLSILGDFECAIGAAAIAHHHAFDIFDVKLPEQKISP